MFKYIDDFWLTVKMAKVHNSEEFYFDKFNESNEQILNLTYRQIKNMALPVFISIGGIIALVFVVYTAHNIAHLPTSLLYLFYSFGRIFPQFKGNQY
jgi:ATP-binding cassette subfamily C protein